MPEYLLNPLTPDLCDFVYPLVQAANPTLSLEGWKSFYDEIADPMRFALDQDEIVVVQDRNSYARGLCISAPRRNLFYGRLLDVSAIVVASIGDDQGVARVMLRHLRDKSARLQCDAIRIRTPQRERWFDAFPELANHLQEDRLIVLPAARLHL